MSKIDELYDIRKAKQDEQEEIMEFIKENWNENHILAKNQEFFLYEHGVNEELDFVVAVKKNTNSIVGILGVLRASQSEDNLDIWAGIWKVVEGEIPLLGFEIYKRTKKIYNARSISSVGDNQNTTVRLMKALTRNKVVKMKHFYMLADKEKYSIAKVKYRNNILNDKSNNDVEMFLIENFKDIDENHKIFMNIDMIPYKDSWYVNHKYFEHPINNYKVWGIREGKELAAIIVGREQMYNDTFVLRIVDYIGDFSMISRIKGYFNEMLKRYEYIDFYQYGFDEIALFNAGFIERKENDENVIPNYFSPFVRENIDIWCNSSEQGCIFFKGDGDQDRPN